MTRCTVLQYMLNDNERELPDACVGRYVTAARALRSVEEQT
jgi:hypothetical protein